LFQAIQKRLRKEDEGFTLIELMVVVLIIAILIAIAIPTFLGARTKAQNRAAQVELRQGLLTAKDYYTENETFLDTDAATSAATYESAEPSLDFDTAGSTTSVGVLVVDEDTIVLARQSKSGDWFCISEEISEGTGYGTGAAVTNVDTRLECASGGW
jgi:type IV pilus assembly protein PilA